jgi:hypothetical protein
MQINKNILVPKEILGGTVRGEGIDAIDTVETSLEIVY